MAGILTIIAVVFMIASVANCQSHCRQGRSSTAEKRDNCTLAINNLRRVGSSSIACQPGECRDQWREAFADGTCWYNFYNEETLNDICSGKYDCNARTVSHPTFVSNDVVHDSVCSEVSNELSSEGCSGGIINLRTSGSQGNKACSGRCPQLINTVVGRCGYDTINTYTLEEITDYCTGRYDDACGGSRTVKELSMMVFLMAVFIIYYWL